MEEVTDKADKADNGSAGTPSLRRRAVGSTSKSDDPSTADSESDKAPKKAEAQAVLEAVMKCIASQDSHPNPKPPPTSARAPRKALWEHFSLRRHFGGGPSLCAVSRPLAVSAPLSPFS